MAAERAEEEEEDDYNTKMKKLMAREIKQEPDLHLEIPITIDDLKESISILEKESSTLRAREKRYLQRIGELEEETKRMGDLEEEKWKAVKEADQWKRKYLELQRGSACQLLDESTQPETPGNAATGKDLKRKKKNLVVSEKLGKKKAKSAITAVKAAGSTSPSSSRSAERAYTGRISSSKQQAEAIDRAKNFQRKLESRHPSFLKLMLPSHVSGGFWLGLPAEFCNENLPSETIKMILEDAKGVEREAIFIGMRTGLSGGWRGFAIDHHLEIGDALMFELTTTTRFKVHIFKAILDEPTEDTVDNTQTLSMVRANLRPTEDTVDNTQTLSMVRANLKSRGKGVSKSGTVLGSFKCRKKLVSKQIKLIGH